MDRATGNRIVICVLFGVCGLLILLFFVALFRPAFVRAIGSRLASLPRWRKSWPYQLIGFVLILAAGDEGSKHNWTGRATSFCLIILLTWGVFSLYRSGVEKGHYESHLPSQYLVDADGDGKIDRQAILHYAAATENGLKQRAPGFHVNLLNDSEAGEAEIVSPDGRRIGVNFSKAILKDIQVSEMIDEGLQRIATLAPVASTPLDAAPFALVASPPASDVDELSAAKAALEKAARHWEQREFQLALDEASLAHGIYMRRFGSDHSETIKVGSMIDAAKSQIAAQDSAAAHH